MSSKVKREKKSRANNNNNEKINLQLQNIEPLSDTQEKLFEQYNEYPHLFLHGYAGTGKSFLALYLGFLELLKPESTYKKITIVRSAVPTRDIGFLPGSARDKIRHYEQPYIAIVNQLFNHSNAYEIMKSKGRIEFISTSFIRGTTIDDTIFIIDEAQNTSFHELNSVITRVGVNTKLIVCADIAQTEDSVGRAASGIVAFSHIVDNMKEHFANIAFTVDDIVRSEFVRDWIIASNQYFDDRNSTSKNTP